MAGEPTKKASALPTATSSTAADFIYAVHGGISSKIYLASGGGLDVDLLDGYHANDLHIPRGYIDGLTLSNAADADHDITIAVGTARDSTNALALELASAITKRLDAAWSVGTDQGGLDVGSIGASAVYYLWLIRRDIDGVLDALFSLSKTAPTMPSGFTYKRRIGTIITDASAKIIGFQQVGNKYFFNQPISIAYGYIGTTARTAKIVIAPPKMLAMLRLLFIPLQGGSDVYIWIDSYLRPDSAPSSTNFDMSGNTSNARDSIYKEILTNDSMQIFYRGTDSTNYIGIISLGWIDDRGQNL